MLLNIKKNTQNLMDIPVIFPVLMSFELLVWPPATSLYVVKSALALAPLWLNGIVGKFCTKGITNRFKWAVEGGELSIVYHLYLSRPTQNNRNEIKIATYYASDWK